MAIIAVLMGATSVVLGLGASREWDTQSGPAVVVAALGLFLLSLTPLAGWLARSKASTAAAQAAREKP